MKNGFTLSEVLITLGIIGVVAAMTMPTLIQNHQKRSLEVATQKFYSMMSQAVRHYMADEGVDDLRNTTLASDNYESMSSNEALSSINNFVTEYLKVVKECKQEVNNCFPDNYKSFNGTLIGALANYQEYMNYVLADGSIIQIRYFNKNAPIELYVDVNGRKAPNKAGYDLWNMTIFYDGSIDEGSINPECKKGIVSPYSGDKCGVDWGSSPAEVRQAQFEYCKGNAYAYGGCFGHFLENNFKFDY